MDKIDYLVNNAGVLLPVSSTIRYTPDKHELHYGVNFLGHYLLVHYLWPKLIKSPHFRIVNTSSITHSKIEGFFQDVTFDIDNMNFEDVKYTRSLAYSRSKLYVNMATHAYAEKAGSQGQAVSVHPGVARTPLVDNSLNWFNKMTYFLFYYFAKNSEQASHTTMYALLSDKLINGGYYA